MIIDESRFRRSVQEGLAHLYQPEYLRAHSLASALLAAGLIRAVEDLPALMLGAIEQLCPPGAAPRSSTGWRQYRYLHLRYVECATHRRIAEDLQISTRQACREHDAGLGAVAGLLWSKYAKATEAQKVGARPVEAAAPSPGEATAGAEAAEAELLRVGSEPPDGATNLAEVLDAALATLARMLAARGLVVRSDFAADVPPVAVNRLALRHIILNLIGYLAEGTRAASLVIAAETEANVVSLSFVPGDAVAVSPGPVPPAPPTPDDENPGLTVARRLVEMQGGQLRVLTTGDAPDWAVLELPATQATTVMLVDDSADIGRLFRRYLADSSYCLVHARSAERARRLIREARPGVILLDVILPKDDGWQLLASLRANEETASLPVIVCSVVPERSLANALGVAFLPKPISRQALLAALDSATAERSA